MEITVHLFSHLKYALEAASLTLDLPAGATSADVVDAVRGRLSAPQADIPLQVAVNQVYVREAVPLQAGDEVALIPPVQGG